MQIDNLLQLIGGTPLVPLRRMPTAGSGAVLAKCEQQNPGGSVKDRVALAMVDAAEAAGLLRRPKTPGRPDPDASVIVEPTSGNTGIGLALVCGVRGYRLVLTMSEAMSLERRSLLRAYGAELVLTPEHLDMAGAVERAEALCREDSRFYMPQQFQNPANPETHRRTTGPEIIAQVQRLGRRGGAQRGGAPSIDAFVAGVGTGGTISGVGQALREAFPGVKIIAVEPATSAVLSGGKPSPHRLQGIGAGFVPKNLDRDLLTEVRTVSDRDAYQAKTRLAREEGLLVGISAGAAVHVALQVAAELGPESTVVTVLCDTGERYFSLDEYFA